MKKLQAIRLLKTDIGKKLYPHGALIRIWTGAVKDEDGVSWDIMPYFIVNRHTDGQVLWLTLREFGK